MGAWACTECVEARGLTVDGQAVAQTGGLKWCGVGGHQIADGVRWAPAAVAKVVSVHRSDKPVTRALEPGEQGSLF